jgi:NAD+ synthase (glutamine-hydrolysing)
VRVAIAQINTTVGDLENNRKKILEWAERAREAKADTVIFPEMAVTGYPPEDLLLKTRFIEDNLESVKSIAGRVSGITAVVGFVDKDKKGIYNAAAVIENGKIKGVYRKNRLPNYGVFDEKRYFTPGSRPLVLKLRGTKYGVNICEDIWQGDSEAKKACSLGAKTLIVINASPYHEGKILERESVVLKQAKKNKAFIVYANLVGGQDELVFDGYSMVASPAGKIIARAEGFKEDLLIVDIPETIGYANRISRVLEPAEEVYNALVLGVRDYMGKNGFKKAVIGLSGGIDSSLVAAVAADAAGKENITGIFMPSRYSSRESREDAEQLAKNLGINFLTIPIDELFGAYLKNLEPAFAGAKPDITEENLQARIRGNILMAMSNKFGWIALTTGNKSEMSTGYATLYGDMAGGFAVIKDVLKGLVYKLSGYRNSIGRAIPQRVITKEPTAELRPNQKDSDSLPPYSVLDPVLERYVEQDMDGDKIAALGFDAGTVAKVIRLVDKSEYKRRQSPPGIKITPKSFGKDRRIPITNKY